MKTMLCVVALLAAACASTDNFLRPPATTELIEQTKEDFDGRVKLRCVRTGPKYTKGDPANGCLYESVQLSFGPSSTLKKDERNALIDYVRLIADRNCANFISRAFANRTGLDTTRNVIKDAATGVAAGTAKMLPGVSAGLGFVSLFGGNLVDNINSSYYLRDTFPALKNAIETARSAQLAMILDKKKLEPADYSLWEAILDLEQYGHLCSFDTAVKELTARSSPPPARGQTPKVQTVANPQGNSPSGPAPAAAQQAQPAAGQPTATHTSGE